MKRYMRRLGDGGDGDDPLQGVANFFDLGIVFALGFMIALISYMGLPELLVKQKVTVVKNPGTPEMEVIIKDGETIEHYKVGTSEIGGTGVKLGEAYRLKSGDVIYVPVAE